MHFIIWIINWLNDVSLLIARDSRRDRKEKSTVENRSAMQGPVFAGRWEFGLKWLAQYPAVSLEGDTFSSSAERGKTRVNDRPTYSSPSSVALDIGVAL